ncbi:uncharacterized protein N7482_002228 [Penicillium canariense]|uniref:Uncharacterized protein n=1 Tax=Penicillium canariense TaxID=189055 RepID=A0A9W9ILB5_9EURO|nr:uncharacterized protein N7482_002228 [Penicillium canariense]KAJ5176351.1 hypothetical protein N7482_002228 [Penicillium canariense]
MGLIRSVLEEFPRDSLTYSESGAYRAAQSVAGPVAKAKAASTEATSFVSRHSYPKDQEPTLLGHFEGVANRSNVGSHPSKHLQELTDVSRELFKPQADLGEFLAHANGIGGSNSEYSARAPERLRANPSFQRRHTTSLRDTDSRRTFPSAKACAAHSPAHPHWPSRDLATFVNLRIPGIFTGAARAGVALD